MKVEIRSDKVIIDGYVNAVERPSRPLYSRFGRFIEKICAGAFGRALKRNDDVRILLNHDWNRNLGGTKTGELELEEDAIGLHARAEITDPAVIEDARNGNLVGWSFGFNDVPDGVIETRDEESGLPFRKVKDLDLHEVSILNRSKTPAYIGTLVNVRDNCEILLGDSVDDAPEVVDLTRSEEPETPQPKEVTSETLASYKNIIAELHEIRDSGIKS